MPRSQRREVKILTVEFGEPVDVMTGEVIPWEALNWPVYPEQRANGGWKWTACDGRHMGGDPEMFRCVAQNNDMTCPVHTEEKDPMAEKKTPPPKKISAPIKEERPPKGSKGMVKKPGFRKIKEK